jgi:hypothetical protein
LRLLRQRGHPKMGRVAFTRSYHVANMSKCDMRSITAREPSPANCALNVLHHRAHTINYPFAGSLAAQASYALKSKRLLPRP